MAKMVKLYKSKENANFFGSPISSVAYNDKLGNWDGQKYCEEDFGFKKGITKLRSGSYVLIEDPPSYNGRAYAYKISDKEALDEILESGHKELLDQKKFDRLKELYKSMILKDVEKGKKYDDFINNERLRLNDTIKELKKQLSFVKKSVNCTEQEIDKIIIQLNIVKGKVTLLDDVRNSIKAEDQTKKDTEYSQLSLAA